MLHATSGHYVGMGGTGSHFIQMTKTHVKLGNNKYYKKCLAPRRSKGGNETLICTIALGVSLPLNTDNHQVVYDPGHNTGNLYTTHTWPESKKETEKRQKKDSTRETNTRAHRVKDTEADFLIRWSRTRDAARCELTHRGQK